MILFIESEKVESEKVNNSNFFQKLQNDPLSHSSKYRTTSLANATLATLATT
jgi:hypothetical protein